MDSKLPYNGIRSKNHTFLATDGHCTLHAADIQPYPDNDPMRTEGKAESKRAKQRKMTESFTHKPPPTSSLPKRSGLLNLEFAGPWRNTYGSEYPDFFPPDEALWGVRLSDVPLSGYVTLLPCIAAGIHERFGMEVRKRRETHTLRRAQSEESGGRDAGWMDQQDSKNDYKLYYGTAAVAKSISRRIIMLPGTRVMSFRYSGTALSTKKIYSVVDLGSSRLALAFPYGDASLSNEEWRD
ncbi:hypothetical protein L228DRAFT_259029 [Xylona heveae TC161]|uniref:Uncharacterized protein n=1 Tax=Xylona heveae (strain CBS 132557 / TC161) TaxID=1328760 RepID=A0A165J277_XYLHT|nr:hypothetical protein L228DRAFT_259029 [Xylona heveae TC161]KZF25634.1 hypothetical protein L228DRAFT_259029 [Xylona heveae TC161]